MTGSTSERWPWLRKGALAAIFAAVATLAAFDLAHDLRAGTTVQHAAIEGGTAALALAVTAGLTVQLVAARRARQGLELDAAGLRASLTRAKADADGWRREASRWTRGLGDEIDRQLSVWALTPAEKEVALLLLKGLSHKEIAAARAVEESSVRQQARSLYRKAGIQSRSELAAFFLEDLLAPRAGTASESPEARS